MAKRKMLIIIGVIVLLPAIGVGWWLVSPLFLSTTVDETLPAAVVSQASSDQPTAPSTSQASAEQPTAPSTPQASAEQSTSSSTPQASAEQSTAASTPQASSEQSAEAVVMKRGALQDADDFHQGSGQAVFYKTADGSTVLRLEDINVTNGPDLYVYLSPHPAPATSEEVQAEGYANLGKLRGNIGNLNYPIPADVDVSKQQSVVIYCLAFHVVFSIAPLQ